MSYSIYRRDFIRRGIETAAALSAFTPAVRASRNSEAQDAVAERRAQSTVSGTLPSGEGENQDSVAELLRCSFCSKSQNEVAKLIAGPGVYICGECVDVCQEILADTVIDDPDSTGPSEWRYGCNLCGVVWGAEQITFIRDRGVAVCNQCVDAILATLTPEKTNR